MNFEEFKKKFIKLQEESGQSWVTVILASGGYIPADGFAQYYEVEDDVVLLLNGRFIIAEIPLSSIIDIKLQ